MRLSDIMSYLEVCGKESKDVDIKDIKNDSRQVCAGDLFVAVSGEKNDGHLFIKQAVEKGAAAILSEKKLSADVPVIQVNNVRSAQAKLATALYPSEHMQKVAVTGTNGKTSTVFFVEQIMNASDVLSASMGTVGVSCPVFHAEGTMTTPDSIHLNKMLHMLHNKGVRVTALETSSHGLDQGRLEGLTFKAAAFTNLTLDHLDYHKTMESYFKAKQKLFSVYLDSDGTAVLNADVPQYSELKKICEDRSVKILSYGYKGKELRIISQQLTPTGQDVVLEVMGNTYQFHLNIFGDFQLMNLMAAIGLCMGAGLDADHIMSVVPTLKAPTGRIEPVCRLKNGSQIFVDYAHTPDALERALSSLRSHVSGRLVCLFGCGGNRDTSKRSKMGEIADRLADIVYITDDNPRFEDPQEIRSQIAGSCHKGQIVNDRSRAVFEAVEALEKNDILLLAGKGHESGQSIKGVSYAYNDTVEAKLAVSHVQELPLWTAEELSVALSVSVDSFVSVFGISKDTRSLNVGDLFIALKGENVDGHDFVYRAVQSGAAACLVDHKIDNVPLNKQIIVSDTTLALDTLARFARMRSDAIFIGITGRSGKTTTKEMLKACLSSQGITYATEGNFNNELGVPLTLIQMPRQTQYAIIEMGMNHFGEMMYLSDLVRPHVSVITTIGSAHRAFFKSDEEIAQAKSEIFEFQDTEGTVLINKENAYFDQLTERAGQQGIKHIISFGQGGDIYPVSEQIHENRTVVKADIRGHIVHYTLNYLGHHFVLDSLAVLGVIEAIGASVDAAVREFKSVFPVSGRGKNIPVTLENGKQFLLIDDAYNANPASMKASIQTLGLMSCKGKRIAVLGDMLELGETALDMHLDLRQTLEKEQIDRVYVSGKLMNELFVTLPSDKQGKAVSEAKDLVPILKQELNSGDVVLVKASHGCGLDSVIRGLKGDC